MLLLTSHTGHTSLMSAIQGMESGSQSAGRASDPMAHLLCIKSVPVSCSTGPSGPWANGAPNRLLCSNCQLLCRLSWALSLLNSCRQSLSKARSFALASSSTVESSEADVA